MTNFISEDSDVCGSYPGFFRFKDESVITTTDENLLEFCSCISIVVCEDKKIVKNDNDPVFEVVKYQTLDLPLREGTLVDISPMEW